MCDTSWPLEMDINSPPLVFNKRTCENNSKLENLSFTKHLWLSGCYYWHVQTRDYVELRNLRGEIECFWDSFSHSLITTIIMVLYITQCLPMLRSWHILVHSSNLVSSLHATTRTITVPIHSLLCEETQLNFNSGFTNNDLVLTSGSSASHKGSSVHGAVRLPMPAASVKALNDFKDQPDKIFRQ